MRNVPHFVNMSSCPTDFEIVPIFIFSLKLGIAIKSEISRNKSRACEFNCILNGDSMIGWNVTFKTEQDYLMFLLRM